MVIYHGGIPKTSPTTQTKNNLNPETQAPIWCSFSHASSYKRPRHVTSWRHIFVAKMFCIKYATNNNGAVLQSLKNKQQINHPWKNRRGKCGKTLFSGVSFWCISPIYFQGLFAGKLWWSVCFCSLSGLLFTHLHYPNAPCAEYLPTWMVDILKYM